MHTINDATTHGIIVLIFYSSGVCILSYFYERKSQEYKKTQKSSKPLKRLENEDRHCEFLALTAILDAILDFKKCSEVKLFHKAEFAYVMS